MFTQDSAVIIREFTHTRRFVCNDGSVLEQNHYICVIQRESNIEGWEFEVLQQVNGVIMSNNVWNVSSCAENEFNQFVLSALNDNNHFYQYANVYNYTVKRLV